MDEQQHLEKILLQQLELLAEQSKICSDEFLPAISSAMVEIYESLTKMSR